jgi:hypothetical protein
LKLRTCDSDSDSDGDGDGNGDGNDGDAIVILLSSCGPCDALGTVTLQQESERKKKVPCLRAEGSRISAQSHFQ